MHKYIFDFLNADNKETISVNVYLVHPVSDEKIETLRLKLRKQMVGMWLEGHKKYSETEYNSLKTDICGFVKSVKTEMGLT